MGIKTASLPATASDVCEVEFVDEATVKSTQKTLKSDQVMRHLAEVFSVISGPTRIKLAFALAKA